MPGRVALVALVLLAGCGTDRMPEPDELVDSGSDTDGMFTLEVRVADVTVFEGEEILVDASLSHDGAADVILAGSGSGVVFFSVTRQEDGLSSGPPVWTDDCAQHVLEAGRPMDVPFAKSGGFSDDDPNAAFLRTYFADRELRLPAGTWRIEATTNASIDECGGEPVNLRAFVDVVVER